MPMWIVLGVTCTGPPATTRQPLLGEPPAFALLEDRFQGVTYPENPGVFDLVTADLEGDGDLDLLLNRHLDVPMELYENDGTGRFTQVGLHESGLWDNPGVPDLFGDVGSMRAEVDALGIPGVFVWHDVDRHDSWRVAIRPDAEPVVVRAHTNRPLVRVEPEEGATVTEIDAWTVEVSCAEACGVTVDCELVGTQLELVALAPVPALPYYAGADLVRFDDVELDLWKDDPHGMTWVDFLGGPEPDLVVNRGALIGQLAPPFDPKRDRVLEHVGGDTTYALRTGVLPDNYARGRQMAWVDVDGDGVEELYAANTDTPSQLWDPSDGHPMVDRAPELGLDLVGDDTFAWLDLDGDGRLDLITAAGRDLRVLLQGDPAFEEHPGAALGLIWPDEVTTAGDGIFNPLALQLLDFDRDGDLDLVAADDQLMRLFRNVGGGFELVPDPGLPETSSPLSLAPADVDDDGWVDLLVAGSGVWLAHNQRGAFVTTLLAEEVGYIGAAVAGDLDGDGRVDLAGFSGGERRLLLRNVTEGPATAVVLAPDAPLGTLVRGFYDDGTVLAQSWGATAVTRYGQGSRPLRFAEAGLRLVSAGDAVIWARPPTR